MHNKVADKAAETHKAIKQVNKLPQKTRAQKDSASLEISRLKNQWWEDCKEFFK